MESSQSFDDDFVQSHSLFVERSNLVGGLEHLDYFSIQLGMIIPTDELIFFRGVGIPPTSNISPIIRDIRVEQSVKIHSTRVALGGS